MLAGATLLALALLLPASAGAANRRISISNYQWSDENFTIDLGEHVNWYWIGPDTMHSITGTTANAAGVDSDPGTNQPQHTIGDNFQVDFDQPGVYKFHCKLHSTVKGTVTVTDTPGNPTAEPDPIPQSQVDLTPPRVGSPFLLASSFGRNGTSMHYTLNEKARLSADYYLLRPGKKPKFAGYKGWKAGHIGNNNVRFGKRGKHFKAKPGKYQARIEGIDKANNSTRPIKLDFKIHARKKK